MLSPHTAATPADRKRKMSTIHTDDFTIYVKDLVPSDLDRIEVEVYQSPMGTDGGCRLTASASRPQLAKFATEILKALEPKPFKFGGPPPAQS